MTHHGNVTTKQARITTRQIFVRRAATEKAVSEDLGLADAFERAVTTIVRLCCGLHYGRTPDTRNVPIMVEDDSLM